MAMDIEPDGLERTGAARGGRWIVTSTAGESVRAFLPHPLPPDPPLKLTAGDHALLSRANIALGRLDGLATVLPNTLLFVYMYIRKEALLSSQIEGTQSSLSDLLAHELDEAPGVPVDDVVEVSNYVAAITYGLDRMQGGFPLSLRLLKEIHGVLLAAGRGSEQTPGEFRRSQNWLGGSRPGNARFVPPPPDRLMECLGPFELFIAGDQLTYGQPEPEAPSLPLLIKIALAHAQFETIHPFLDGNGRLGRLLIPLMLCEDGALRQPVLYLSLHFKTHREEYYDRLQRTRTHGEWEAWVRFFLEGVLSTAQKAVETAQAALALFDRDRKTLQAIGRAAGSTLQVHEALQKQPILSIKKAASLTNLSEPTVSAAFARMEELAMVKEITGRQRDRLYSYAPYITLLAEGTEPLQPT